MQEPAVLLLPFDQQDCAHRERSNLRLMRCASVAGGSSHSMISNESNGGDPNGRDPNGRNKPVALALLASERPRNVGWLQAAGLLFGDWGTSRLCVLGLAFFFAGRTSFWLICGMSLLILAVGWAYTQICRIYADGGGADTRGQH